jgi:hypothetical protein
MDNGGGWLWMVIDVGFVVVLGAALAYGIMMRRRRPANSADDVAPELRKKPELRRAARGD